MTASVDGERGFSSAQWFRSWHGAPTDIKWLLIARLANTLPGIVNSIAWALLDYASQHRVRGSIAGFDVASYAAYSGFEEEIIVRVIAAMRARDMIGPDNRWLNWDKRQPKREDNSTERVRNYRARKTEATLDLLPLAAETPTDTQCNAEEQDETTGNAREEENIVNSDASASELPPAETTLTLSPHQELCGAIATVCAKDLKVKSHATRVGHTASVLRAAGYDANSVRNFGLWWVTDIWRKEHKPVPSLADLEDKIKQGAQYQPRAPTNGFADNPPQRPDPPVQQRMQAWRLAHPDGVPEA